MTDAQRDVLLALNYVQMRATDAPEEDGYTAREVSNFTRRSVRSTAVILSQMRDFGWVQSLHSYSLIGWVLMAKGVQALERDRAVAPLDAEARP